LTTCVKYYHLNMEEQLSMNYLGIEKFIHRPFNDRSDLSLKSVYYVTISPSRSVRCETNKPPAMRVRVEGYTKKTPNAIQ